MKTFSLTSRKIESLLYAFVWLFVFAVPFLGRGMADAVEWNRLYREWTQLMVFLIIFLVNVYFLVPRLLFEKKYFQYFAGLLIMLVLLTGGILMINSGVPEDRNQSSLPTRDEYGLPQGKPPHMIIIDNFIIAILVVGSGTASKLVTKWLDEEKLRKDIEKEQLKTNLALLRHQVSPHFFMNTLNNIHALIDINTEHAKDAIIRLSTLMRYLLYDSAQGRIDLKKEIEFINSFISLMRLRYSDKVDIAVVVPAQIPDIQIPPMLFISFLENAFKHGVSYQSPSFIHLELRIDDSSLACRIQNSKQSNQPVQNGEYSGIGLENMKKSLSLLYGDNYTLVIADTLHEYAVDLRIPL